MDGSLESLINLYVFTTGRLIFGIGQVRAAAAAQSFTALVKHCDMTLAHARATREMERRWAGEPADTGTNPEAQRIDVLVDGALGAIRDHAMAQTRGAASDDPIHDEVAAFVKTLFPTTVHAVTSLPYVEELAAVDDIVKLLKGSLAAKVKDFGLSRLAKRLEGLADQYRDALDAAPTSLMPWDKVRAARAEGQGLLLETVAIILGKHHERTAAGTAERVALLGPILKQNDQIGQYLRARRAVSDVDPSTGKDTPGAPGGATEADGAAAPTPAKPNG